MQQVDIAWNPHQKLEFFKLCVRTTLSQMGQITSSMEKQELLLLETTLGNLYQWKEEIVMAPPSQTPNGLMIYIHSTAEIDIDIELTKAKIKMIKDKIAERIMFRSRVKWHEEGEKNNAYFLGLMNSKYTRLDLHKVTDEAGTATEKESIMEKV